MHIVMDTQTGILFTKLLRKILAELSDEARERGQHFQQDELARMLKCNPKTLSAIINKHQVQRVEFELLMEVERLIGTERLRRELKWPAQRGRGIFEQDDEGGGQEAAPLTALLLAMTGEGVQEGAR